MMFPSLPVYDIDGTYFPNLLFKAGNAVSTLRFWLPFDCEPQVRQLRPGKEQIKAKIASIHDLQ